MLFPIATIGGADYSSSALFDAHTQINSNDGSNQDARTNRITHTKLRVQFAVLAPRYPPPHTHTQKLACLEHPVRDRNLSNQVGSSKAERNSDDRC